MSVIVYGPQGTGKTLSAPALAKYFKCTRVVEYEGGRDDPYRLALTTAARFKSGNVLYITNIEPPLELRDARRVMHIDVARRQAGVPAPRSGANS